MNISAFDVLEKYFNVSPSSFEKQGDKYIGACPFHNETNGTSLIIYEKERKFDWVCMGKCHTGGEAPHMLVHGGICASIKDAVLKLREDFNIQLPDTVTLENFSEIKGISLETLEKYGITDYKFYKEGNEKQGLYFPLCGSDGSVVAEKIRTSYTGGKRFFYHKGEFRWFGLQFLNQFTTTKPLYICEGESDTLSLIDAGLQAVGFLGSGGFSIDGIDFSGFSQIVLCCDNDDAGRSLLKHAQTVFPTTLYTIELGKYNDINEFFFYNRNKLRDTLKFFPAVLPAVTSDYVAVPGMWRTLFAGKSELEAMQLCEELKQKNKLPARLVSTAYKQYYRSPSYDTGSELPEERIYIKNARYVKASVVGGVPMEEVLCNFTMRVRQTIRTEDGVVRVCVLTNDEGHTSKPLHLTGDLLANVPAFRAAVISAGNYNWRGSAEDLSCLVDMLQKQSSTIIESPAVCGRHDSVWLMGQWGVDRTGQVQLTDEDGVLNLDGTAYIIRNINTQDDADTASYPTLPQSVNVTDADLLNISQVLKQNLGGYEAYMALGFCVAGWHSDELYRMNGEHNYPLFFIAGKRNSGKSVLANWLMSSYGFGNESMGKNFALPSPVSITRKLGYYNSLPQWYDDYRNGLKDMDRRNHLLLSAYNRQGGDKGTRTGFGVRSEPVRATVLLSGEDTPEDNAVFSRCCVIHVSANRRDDSIKKEVFCAVDLLPAMGLVFLKHKQQHGSEALLEQVDALQHTLEASGVDTRLAKNKAVFAGAFLYHWGHLITDKEDFLKWLIKDTAQSLEETSNNHAVVKFLDDVGAMIVNKEILPEKDFKIVDDTLYLRFGLVYDKWLKRVKQPEFTKSVLLAYFRTENFILGTTAVARVGGIAVRALSIDIKQQPSELLTEAVNAIKTTEEEF